MIKSAWNYIVSHKWSKDILRANLLYIVLVICYDLVHFSLKPVSFHLCMRAFWLMNLCLVIKLFINAYDKVERQR